MGQGQRHLFSIFSTGDPSRVLALAVSALLGRCASAVAATLINSGLQRLCTTFSDD